MDISLTLCPACGSTRIERKRISVRVRSGEVVKGVEAEVCQGCGERFYDLDAMRRLEAQRGQKDW